MDDSRSELRAETLAYVTRHMGDLRSLRAAPLLIFVPLCSMYFYRHGSRAARTEGVAAFLISFVLAFSISIIASWVGAVAIERYYRSRYGEVQASRVPLNTSGMTQLAIYRAPDRATSVSTMEEHGSSLTDAASAVFFVLLIAFAVLFLVSTLHPARHSVGGFFPIGSFFPLIMIFLIPRLKRIPALLSLQVRRCLAYLASLLFFALGACYQWGSLSVPAYIYAMAALALLLVCYDHWLLGHLLLVSRSEPAHG